MKRGGTGGSNTYTGLRFEERVSLERLFDRLPGYRTRGSSMAGKTGRNITYEGRDVARYFEKHEFYRFLEEQGVDWKMVISKRLLPDSALLVNIKLFIIEVKFQQVAGSVDEKLQTCDFKRKQYQKLVRPLNLDVEYVYVLNGWFKDGNYKDVFDYIESVNCRYFFYEIPFSFLNLPVPGDQWPEDVR